MGKKIVTVFGASGALGLKIVKELLNQGAHVRAVIFITNISHYATHAATILPDSALDTIVDVGWDQPATGDMVAQSFSKLLGKNVVPKPAFPPFVTRVILPFLSPFNESIKDMHEMIKWVSSGEYTSKNTLKQKELFGDLPAIEEAVRRYSKDRGLI